MDMTQTNAFFARYSQVLGLANCKKGQSIQCMTAIDLFTAMHGVPPTLDQIVKTILDNGLWFNPHLNRNGVGGSNLVHTCPAQAMYKVRGENVLEQPRAVALKNIKKVLMANVVNTTDYARTSTRKTENSVILRGWVEYRHGRYTLADLNTAMG